MALSSIQTNLLDAIASTTVDGSSFIQGEAAEITTYLTQKIAELQASKTGRATVSDFVADGEALAQAIVAIVGSAPAIKIVGDAIQAINDGEQEKFFALIGDAGKLYADFKALKK